MEILLDGGPLDGDVVEIPDFHGYIFHVPPAHYEREPNQLDPPYVYSWKGEPYDHISGAHDAPAAADQQGRSLDGFLSGDPAVGR